MFTTENYRLQSAYEKNLIIKMVLVSRLFIQCGKNVAKQTADIIGNSDMYQLSRFKRQK